MLSITPCLIGTKWADHTFESWLIRAFTKVSHDILVSKIRNTYTVQFKSAFIDAFSY